VIPALIAKLHNAWAAVPLAVQGALVALVFLVYQFALGYNWTLPTTWHELVTLTSAFFVALWAVALPVIREKLWPALVPWLLQLLQLVAGLQVSSTAAPKSARGIPDPSRHTRFVTLWTKAA
jgi:hypothetical protein